MPECRLDFQNKSRRITNHRSRYICKEQTLGQSQCFLRLDPRGIQRKSNMAFKCIQIERKQPLQIGIPKKLAVCLVALLIPTLDLTRLIIILLAC